MTDDRLSELLDRADVRLTRHTDPTLGVVTKVTAKRRTDGVTMHRSIATDPAEIRFARVDVLALGLEEAISDVHNAFGS